MRLYAFIDLNWAYESKNGFICPILRTQIEQLNQASDKSEAPQIKSSRAAPGYSIY